MKEQYYSQHGEDFLLNKVFNKTDGFFVEVGCIDGRRFSNTLFFEEQGWKGICIEAHSDYIERIKTNRPGSEVVHCAIGEKDEGVVTFYANARGSLSSLDKSTEERWKRDYKQYFSGFEEQKVEKRTLSSVFDQLKIQQIDFISIDIEGYEVEALQGLDLLKHKPTIILIESDSDEHKQGIEKKLLPAGYQLILDFGGNLYYSIDPNLKNSITDKIFENVRLVHTKHHLDEGGDKELIINIDTRAVTKAPTQKSFWNNLKDVFKGK
ncbi:MAG: FkbM family methyltransferase [Bacteroidota bacterium]|nr:FkbM family methyltransferase [Bacteroidota bacterium]